MSNTCEFTVKVLGATTSFACNSTKSCADLNKDVQRSADGLPLPDIGFKDAPADSSAPSCEAIAVAVELAAEFAKEMPCTTCDVADYLCPAIDCAQLHTELGNAPLWGQRDTIDTVCLSMQAACKIGDQLCARHKC